MIRQFQITTSTWRSVPVLQVNNPTFAERNFLRRAILSQITEDIFYIKKQPAKPFLHKNDEQLLVVEFWGGIENATDFVEWLNSQDPEVVQEKFFCAT